MSLHLRAGRPDDAEACGRICYDAFAAIAERHGRIAGSNFMHDTGVVAGVGPITVAPSVQDGAVGRRMMEHMLCVAQDKGFPSVRLVQAAYHCRSMSLYAKLGFEIREPLVCLQGSALGVTLPSCTVRAAARADL